MKKHIIAICVILLVLIILQSCASSSPKKGDICIVGESDNGSTNIKWIDYFDSTKSFINKKDNKKSEMEGVEKEITFEGESYKGVYSDTKSTFIYSSSISDLYSGEGFGFMLDENSGRLTYFARKSTSSDASIDETEGIIAAKHFLGKYIDIDNYQYDGCAEGYSDSQRIFKFKRVIDGIDTSESIKVIISGDETICEYITHALGDFDGFILPSDFSAEVAQKKAEDKLNDIIKEQDDMTISEYSISCDSTILIMYEGRCYYSMQYDVEINYGDVIKSDLLTLFYAVD